MNELPDNDNQIRPFGREPWSLLVATGAGILSFIVCRAVFQHRKSMRLIQASIVVTTFLAALDISDCREPEEL